MAIADRIMPSYGKGTTYHSYTLSKFGTNRLSFVENITVLLHHVNLSHSFTDILILHFWLFSSHYCTDLNKLFCFHISLRRSFHFIK